MKPQVKRFKNTGLNLFFNTAGRLILFVCFVPHVYAMSCPKPVDVRHINATGFLEADSRHVNPSPAQPIEIPVFLPEKVNDAKVQLWSPDDDLIREINLNGFDPGEHKVFWDGLDSDGVPVPDEVYTPVLQGKTLANKQFSIDPRDRSGGEILHGLGASWQWTGGRNIALQLPAPSRLLVRIGVKNGPVLKNLEYWSPKPGGRVVVRWDGYDQDGLAKLDERKDLSVLVMGYCLPAHSLILYGNNTEDYFSYRARKGFVPKRMDLANQPLQRDGMRLEKNYFMPRFPLPQLTLTPIGELNQIAPNSYQLSKVENLQLTIPRDQRWVIDSSFYEIVYYKNFEFQYEEELGFLPISWPVDPDKLGLGRHLITVQISAFSGVFVSRSIALEVTE